jgi:Tfp pilus assembly protein PilF
LGNLGLVYALQQKASESRKLLERALAIVEREGGETNSQTNRVLENLAELSFRNGDQTRASQLYRRVLEQRRALFGEAHFELRLLNALGNPLPAE